MNNTKNNNNNQTSSPSPPPYSPIEPHNVSGSAPSRSAVPQQPQYRAIVIEQTASPIIIANEMERQFPVAALFFIFGWICPFLWIVGAFCCAGSWQPYESWWGHANLLMAIIFTMASLIYTIILFSTGQIHV